MTNQTEFRLILPPRPGHPSPTVYNAPTSEALAELADSIGVVMPEITHFVTNGLEPPPTLATIEIDEEFCNTDDDVTYTRTLEEVAQIARDTGKHFDIRRTDDDCGQWIMIRHIA